MGTAEKAALKQAYEKLFLGNGASTRSCDDGVRNMDVTGEGPHSEIPPPALGQSRLNNLILPQTHIRLTGIRNR